MSLSFNGTVVLALTVSSTFSQVVSQSSFDVATIKLVEFTPKTAPMRVDHGTLRIANRPLREIIRKAYDVSAAQVVGPEWISTVRYEITAKAEGEPSNDRMMMMLRTLLSQRLKLKVHSETRRVDVYGLETGKVPPKVREIQAGEALPRLSTMRALADLLSNFSDRPVIDRTGMKGSYEIKLDWSGSGDTTNGSLQDGMFAAVERLGLRLVSQKAPVDVLVVDSVERIPAEN